ncbi:MAG: hypothetical protein KDK61_08470 [Simkania sp.]|nr:hypothetical protein [Simkania sp.]
MPAVMEYFHYFRIHHHIPQYFSYQPKGLEISLFIHVPNVDEEGVPAIIKLNHFHKSSFPKIPLQIYP